MRILLRLLHRCWDRLIYYRYRARIRDLVARGLVLGKNVTITPTSYVDSGYPYLIRIGNNCSLSNHVRLLAHDATPFKFTGGYARLGRIDIRDNCFIGENTVVLPGVTIGPNVLVAAGSLVNRDIPPNSCAAGVPARVYAKFDAYLERQKRQLKERPIFELSDVLPHPDDSLKKRVMESVQDGDAYVRSSLGGRYTLNQDQQLWKEGGTGQ